MCDGQAMSGNVSVFTDLYKAVTKLAVIGNGWSIGPTKILFPPGT